MYQTPLDGPTGLSEVENRVWNIARAIGRKGEPLPWKLVIGDCIYVSRKLSLRERKLLGQGKQVFAGFGAAWAILPGYREGIQEWAKQQLEYYGRPVFKIETCLTANYNFCWIDVNGKSTPVYEGIATSAIADQVRQWMRITDLEQKTHRLLVESF